MATNGKKWQKMATNGNKWQLLATLVTNDDFFYFFASFENTCASLLQSVTVIGSVLQSVIVSGSWVVVTAVCGSLLQ